MKSRLLFLLAVCLLLLVVFASCGKKEPEKTTPEATTPEVTTPTVTTPDPNAVMYTVVWNIPLPRGERIETQVAEGQIPVPPEVPTNEDEGYRYVFQKWSEELKPVTGDDSYTAIIKKERKTYTVTLTVDDKVYDSFTCGYGLYPEYTGKTPEKAGMTFLFWQNFDQPVGGDTTCAAIFSRYPAATMRAAITAAASANDSNASSAALFLALQEKEVPGSVSDELLTYLRYIGKKATKFNLSPNFYFPFVAGCIAVSKTTDIWQELTENEVERLDYIMKAFAVMAAVGTDDGNSYSTGPDYIGNYNKNWNPNYRLANVTQILFAVSYFGSADAVNQILREFDYDTYVAKFEEFGWTSAYKAWTTMVEGFNDPDGDGRGTYTVTALTEKDKANGNFGEHTVNFVTPKVMLMEGGVVYAITALDRIGQKIGDAKGTGRSVRQIGIDGYHYMGHALSETDAIWGALATHNYGGGKVVSSVGVQGPYYAGIADGSSSPVQGLSGMLLEFKSGARSSLSYCLHDFTMGVGSEAALVALGLYDPTAEENAKFARMIWVGNTDLIYKAEKGYWSFSGDKSRGESKLVTASDGGASYVIWKGYWEAVGGKQFTLDDFDIPKPGSVIVDIVNNENYAKDSSSSPDLTYSFDRSPDVSGNKSYMENAYIFEFSLMLDESSLPFGIRLRGNVNNKRDDIIKVGADGLITPVDKFLTPEGDAPLSYQISGYGWHRIAVMYRQIATPNDTDKTISYTIEVTILVNGVEIGTYLGNTAVFTGNGWLLYTAEYDETAEEHVKQLDNDPEKGAEGVYWQTYRGKCFNDETLAWFQLFGDVIVSCGTEPVLKVTKVTYELNGGAFVQNKLLEANSGYVTEYNYTNAPHYGVAGRTPELPLAAREDKSFLGWFTTPDCTGDPILVIPEGDSVTLYAAWEAVQDGTEP